MARPRAAESPRSKSKTSLIEEITRGIAKFSEILATIDDCNKEGFPYRDGARAKAEVQFRESIRRVFGERSPEFQAHRNHKLRISTVAETKQSIALIKSLIESLEQKKLELQGITPPTPEPEATPAQTKPQMTLVPPAETSSAPVTQNEAPTAPTQPLPAAVVPPTPTDSAPSSEPIPTPPLPPSLPAALPVPSPPIPAAHLTTSQIRTASPATQPPLPVPNAQPSPAATSAPKPAAPQPTEPVAALVPIWATTSSNKTTTDAAPASPVQPAPPPSLPDTSGSTAWASTTASIPRPIFLAEKPASPPHQPGSTPSPVMTAQIEASPRADADPLPALRKICTRFHAVARQLRLRKDYRSTLEVEDDYDLQDLLCALLKFEFEEVASDEWTPPYTSGSPRTTLLIDKDRTAVIAKKTRPGLTAKELAEQVAADAERYAARAHCTNLFCFIYDPEGRIGSPKRLETDLTSVSDNFTVDVLVAPK